VSHVTVDQMNLVAQGGTGSPPAGGGELGQVVGGTIGAMIITAAMFYLVALMQQRLATRAVRA
jgi:hypothetical protein